MKVVECGSSIKKLMPLVSDSFFSDFFRLVRPTFDLPDFESISGFSNQLFVLECNNENKTLLRGQVEILKEEGLLLFIGSPWFKSIDDLSTNHLSFTDFSIKDPMIDMLNVLKTHEIVSNDIKEIIDSLNQQKKQLLQERKELKRLSLVAMGNSNGVVFNNNRGEITYANEGFALMTGYAIEEVLGNTPVSLCVGPNTDPVQVEEIIGHFKRNENYTMEIVLHQEKMALGSGQDQKDKLFWMKKAS